MSGIIAIFFLLVFIIVAIVIYKISYSLLLYRWMTPWKARIVFILLAIIFLFGDIPVSKLYFDHLCSKDFGQHIYKEVGADGYAEDAISSVDLAFRLIDAPA